MSRLLVVPFFLADRARGLDNLCTRLQSIFAARLSVVSPRFDPEGAYDASRGQYNSRYLLGALSDYGSELEDRILGITNVDLFIPVLSYVFGEAQLDGHAALVSSCRLREEVYGLPADDGLLHRRLVKESVHELGHTFGLLHCNDEDCVMRSSTGVEQIDLKSERFCFSCAMSLQGRQVLAGHST